MRDDLIEVEPTNIKGLMESVEQGLELVQLVWCLFPRSSVSAVPLGWLSVKKRCYLLERAMTCLKKMRAEVEFVVTCVPHLWSLDLS